MDSTKKNAITVEAVVNAPADKVWQLWTTPEHIMKWNNASDDWHTPSSSNDVRVGGKFVSVMAAKDGSFSFDFGGEYEEVVPNKLLAYKLGDDRRVRITFTANGNETKVVEVFDPENVNSEELQRTGWQAILNNFKKYAEGK